MERPCVCKPSAYVGWHKVNLKAEFSRFQFRFFFLQGRLPKKGWRDQSALLFIHCWREDYWIHTFPKGISTMWNANSLVQDLNSGCHIYFLRQEQFNPCTSMICVVLPWQIARPLIFLVLHRISFLNLRCRFIFTYIHIYISTYAEITAKRKKNLCKF